MFFSRCYDRSLWLKAFILKVFLIFSLTKSENISKNFYDYQFENIKNDIGLNWDSTSVFNSTNAILKLNNLKKNKIQLKTIHQNSNTKILGDGYFFFKKKYFLYFSPSINTELLSSNNKSMLLGSNHKSSIGLHNNWVTLKFERGTEGWGAGNNLGLTLSHDSEPYDFFSLDSDYGNIRVKYIHGILESRLDINRYITGRAIEWTNKKSLIVGLSEIIIYSGKEIPIDFSYLNPIANHLEIEFNKRAASSRMNGSNATWQISIDSFLKGRIRFSFNFLIDEYVLDKIERKAGKAHGLGYSTSLVYTLFHKKRQILTLFGNSFAIGTHTFRNANGNNNFVNNNKPTGWKYGSDGKQFSLGFNYVVKKRMICKIEFSHRSYGENSIIYKTYEPYLNYNKGPFPSGQIKKEQMVEILFSYLLKNQTSLFMKTNIYRKKNDLKLGIKRSFSFKNN